MSAILIQYQIHPENTVLHLLRDFFPMTGITERKGFETRIIQGHPLFSESVNQNNNNAESIKIELLGIRLMHGFYKGNKKY